MRRLVIFLLALVPALLGPVAPARAETVGAEVHGWFSGADEVWAGKFGVDFTLNYRTHQPTQGSAPGFVVLGTVDFEVRDPSGHASSAVSVLYHYFDQVRPAPLPGLGPIDPYDEDYSRPIVVKASADAVGGTWRIRPRYSGFNWYLNGTYLDHERWPQTLAVTEDWYSFTVHPASAPAPTSAPTRPSGATTHPAPTPTAAASLAPTTPEPTTSPEPSSAAPSASDAPETVAPLARPARKSGGPSLWLILAAAAATAALGLGTGLLLLRRRSHPAP